MIRDMDATLGRSSGMRGQAVGYTIAALAEGVVFALLVPILRALFDEDPAAAVPWLIGAVIAGLVCGLAQWITENRSYYLAVDNIGGGMMHRLGEHAARIPLGWFAKERTGRLTQLITDSAEQLTHLPGLTLSQIIRSTVTPLTVLLVTIFVDWRMALAMAALIPLGALAYRQVARSAAAEYAAASSIETELSARVIEYAQAQPVLRAAGKREEGWQRLDAALAGSRDATVRQLQRAHKPLTRYAAVAQLGFALVTAVGVLLATTGSLAVPDLLAILVLAVRFAEPLSTLAAYGEGVQLTRVSLANFREVLDVPPLPEPDTPRTPDGSAIELDGVVFGYGDEPVLHSVDLVMPERSVTALVGLSGSGKTTVTRLIARFWDVDRGAIRIGDVDVRDIGTEILMPRIAMVFQQVYLFDGTIAENIRLARPDATDDEVRAAATAAGLDEVVDRLPRGWDTRVGEGGSMLSGGERQRVSIARALLKDAPIVLLDEVTSALDAENEAAVTDAIRRLAHGRTVVIIAHRLSTITTADQIVYLDGGRVVETGRHEELLTANGRYTRLWAERIEAEGWQITKAD